MKDIEIEIKFKTKLKEILKELSKPKKYEPGFVDARRIISDGLSIIGMDSTDILGFAKEANENRARRVKGAQAWYKKMYQDGWRFVGAFEYEGLTYNGFVVMEREIPNKRLQELIESLTEEEKEVLPTTLTIDKGPKLPTQIFPKERKKIEVVYEANTLPDVPKPREGFEEELADFIVDAQEGMKTLEQLFFDETGKNAVYRGKVTKGFIKWKEDRD